jgi:hypothetical protein
MPKARGRKGQRKSGGPPANQPPSQKSWSLFSKFFGAILAAATLFGATAAAVTFLPRITVDASEPFDPSGPAPISFVIANISFVPLRDIQARLGLCGVGINTDNEPNPYRCPEAATGYMGPKTWHRDRLEMDDKFTIAFDDAFINNTGYPIRSADIRITVS